MPRVVILGTSGAGKTTVARALGRAYQLPPIHLDALTDGSYRPVLGKTFDERVAEVVAGSDWIIDGDYQRRLGDLVLSHAEIAVWLDLPLPISLERMRKRTIAAIRSGDLTLQPALISWVVHEVHSHVRRRLTMQKRLSAHPNLHVVHLRSQRQVDNWLASDPLGSAGTDNGAERD